MMYEHPGQAAALDAIDAAPLSAPVYRTARRLLDLADAAGYCNLTAADLLAVCATDTKDTVRHHLFSLRRANLIEYSSGRLVSVRFLDCERRGASPSNRYGEGQVASADAGPARFPVVEETGCARRVGAVARE